MSSNLVKSKVTNVVAAGLKNQVAILEFSESMRHLDNLCMIYLLPEWPQNVSIATDLYQLQMILLLDVPEEHVYNAMETLANMLPYMNKLEELHFARMTTLFLESIDNLLCLIRERPSSLGHLNICGYESDQLTLILEEKHKLKTLHKLNLGFVPTETGQVQLIRQELQLLNSNLEVYCDPDEAPSALMLNRGMETNVRDTLYVLNEIIEQ